MEILFSTATDKNLQTIIVILNQLIVARVAALLRKASLSQVIHPDFPRDLTGFFQGKHWRKFLVDKMQDVRYFVRHNCIFDAEPVYSKFQVTTSRIKKVQQTLNLKP